MAGFTGMIILAACNGNKSSQTDSAAAGEAMDSMVDQATSAVRDAGDSAAKAIQKAADSTKAAIDSAANNHK